MATTGNQFSCPLGMGDFLKVWELFGMTLICLFLQDADSNNAYYEFVVTAKDQGEPPRTGTATVRLIPGKKF